MCSQLWSRPRPEGQQEPGPRVPGIVSAPRMFSFSDQVSFCLRADRGTFTFPEQEGLLEKRDSGWRFSGFSLGHPKG